MRRRTGMTAEDDILRPDDPPHLTLDGAAFEALFRAHHRGLCGFAYRFVRSPEAAEELVQDVFAALWARRDELGVRSSLKAYLYRAVRNRALNWLEHQGIVDATLERPASGAWSRGAAAVRAVAPSAPANPGAPDAALEASELRARLARALDVLPERCRLVLRLRYLEQMSHAEVAEAMGISIKGVENQLGRGLKALRRMIPPDLPA